MRKFPIACIVFTTLIISLFSCADEDKDDINALEEMAFSAWMNKYASTAVLQSNGMYIELINDATDPSSTASADTIVWVRFNYTGTDLHNGVYVTRAEDEARRQNTYTVYTYYTPDYVRFSNENTGGIIAGRFYAMKNELMLANGSTTKLREGSKIRIYMPSSLAFGSTGFSNNQGYGGQYALSGSRPVIEEIEIVEIVKNPVTREEKLVKDHAENLWGLNPTDTIAAHLYIDSTFNIANSYAPTFDAKYDLSADSTAKIWFVGRFLDGFMFNSNIEEVQIKEFRQRAGDAFEYSMLLGTSVMSYTPSNDGDSNISAFYKAVPELRRGLWYRMAFTSAYGYGSTGRYASSTTVETEIQPYTPLIFEFYIATGADDEEIIYY